MFDGYPFLNRRFNAQRLMAAVSASRLHRFGLPLTPQHCRDVLSPAIESSFAASGRGFIRFSPASDSHLADISDALASLRSFELAWQPLLDIPVRYGLLTDSQAISCSSPGYPQHIFLSPAAFDDRSELREQLLHEFCHVWLYLLQEVVRLVEMPDESFTLPSGTANRNAEEVFGAAHVACTLCIYYCGLSRSATAPGSDVRMLRELSARRLEQLRPYAVGCIAILHALRVQQSMTPEGERLLSQMETTTTSLFSTARP